MGKISLGQHKLNFNYVHEQDYIMMILSKKMIITLEHTKLQTPNKYHLVPYSETNHLMPNLVSLGYAQLK